MQDARDGEAGTRLDLVRGARPPRTLVPAWQQARPRHLTDEQIRRYEGWLGEILEALGMPPDTPGTRRTPQRLLSALLDATRGYEGDAKAVTVFPSERHDHVEARDQVIEGPIRLHALCEHHALPFFGDAYVAYVPADRILGISKLTRIVRLYAARFTVQERIGREVAEAVTEAAGARGAAVSIAAAHMCTRMRGVAEPDAVTRTQTWLGAYEADEGLRAEFLAHLALAGRTSRS